MKRFCLQFFEILMLSTLISEYKGDIYFDQPVKFGQATYYSGGMGSCGQSNSGYRVAAITVRYMGNPPNGNPNLHPLCAPQYCILVTGPVGSIVVKVSDTLGSGMGEDNIDLYDDVYTQVATKVLGRVIVAWKFVDCSTNPLGPTSKTATSVISAPSLSGASITAGLVYGGAIAASGTISAGAISGGAVAAKSISPQASSNPAKPNISPASSNSVGTCTGDGVFATPDCSGFYHCIANKPSSKVICPSGTLFDSTISNCNAASLVKCGSSDPASNVGIDLTNVKDGIFASPNCEGYYHCVKAGLEKPVIKFIRCPSGTLFDASLSICNHQSMVKCESTGPLLNPYSNPAVRSSPNQSPYPDSNLPDLDLLSNLPDSDLSSNSGGFSCSRDGIFPSPGCEGYFQCVSTNSENPIKLFIKCPAGTLFDTIVSTCNHQGLVKCESSVYNPPDLQPTGFITAGSLAVNSLIPDVDSVSIRAGSVQEIIIKPSDNFPFVCPHDGFFAVLPLCNQYVQCVHTNTIYAFRGMLTCPEGTIFDSTIKTCNWKTMAICS